MYKPLPCSIIGIDPGTNTLGCATISFDPVSFNILSTESRTFRAARQMSENWMTQYEGERIARLRFLKETLFNIFATVQPMAVVAESNFMSMRRPTAYGALVESVASIREALHQWNPTKVLYMVEPNVAKLSVGVKNFRDKEAVREALLKLELNYVGSESLTQIDEHSCDAIAIAYSKYVEFKQYALVEQELRAKYGLVR